MLLLNRGEPPIADRWKFKFALWSDRSQTVVMDSDSLNSIPVHSRQSVWNLRMRPGEEEALAFLLPLSEDYPGIDRWFRTKVVPGLRNGSRFLLPVERGGRLVGLGIAKLEPDERKICTVRISPSHIGRGLGVRIFDGLLRWLDDDKPHLTVSAGKLPAFERLFDWYGFTLTSIQNGIYVPHSSEFGYNELTPSVANAQDLNQSSSQSAV